MLTRRDDGQLIAQFIASHDPALREEIVMNYLPLVHFVLGRLAISQNMGPEYEDAASQGLIGLIEAVDHYDPRFGTQFSTYATLKIRGHVLDHLRSLDWLSRSARRRARTVQAATNTLWGQLQHSPSDDELADYIGCDHDTLQQSLIDAGRVIISLDSATNRNEEGENSLYDILPDENEENNPAQVLDDQELKEDLVKAIKTLPDRQQLLLSLYYYDELTFKEIGEVLGITESRACQLHTRAILDLQSQFVQVVE
jgi:RNA polymerase sigma factor FliA